MPKINVKYEPKDYKKCFQSENEYMAFRVEWEKLTREILDGMKKYGIKTIPIVKKEG